MIASSRYFRVHEINSCFFNFKSKFHFKQYSCGKNYEDFRGPIPYNENGSAIKGAAGGKINLPQM
jgi:hypothetical protein